MFTSKKSKSKSKIILFGLLFLCLIIIIIIIYKYRNIIFESFESFEENKINKIDKIDLKDDRMYIVYSIGNSEYQEWQADLLDFSFVQSGQKGTLIRLVSDDSNPPRPIPKSKVGYTISTPDYSKFSKNTVIPFMNKSGSLDYLMKNLSQNFIKRNKNAVMVFLDPDMIFVNSWDPLGKFKVGEIYGQKWKGYSQNYCQKSSINKSLCPKNDNDTFMYPFAARMRDIEKIAPDIKKYAYEGYAHNPNNWMLEMVSYVNAAVKHKLKVQSIDNLGLCNDWDNHNDSNAPIMHYCQVIRNNSRKNIWGKRRYNLNYDKKNKKFDTNIPQINEATNRVDREVLKMIHKYIKYQKKNRKI